SGNATSARFFGLSKEQMRHKRGSELGISQESTLLWIEHYKEARAARQPILFEYSHQTPSGGYWLRASVAYIGQNRAGKDRFSYVVDDITERKKMENALRESGRRYRELFVSAERQARELALRDQVSTAVAGEVDLGQVMRAVVESVARSYGFTLVSLYLIKED